MKDVAANKNLFNKDTMYKDVVIIGNGPSGISLSYMLAGNWPYWSKDKILKHPDELLRARLTYYDSNKSLVEHDLFSLADGLEGRSTNPVSLLLDSLQHPYADLGMELPCMVEYKYHPDKEINHLVLGRGSPGGSWHRMDPNLRTLSLAAWMSLPGLNFTDWEKVNPPKSETYHNDVNEGDHVSETMNVNNAMKSNNGANVNNVTKMMCDTCDNCNELKSSRTKKSASGEMKVPLKCNKCRLNNNSNNNSNNNNRVNTIVYEDNGKINVKLFPPRRDLSLKRQLSKEVETRALISRVAQYYENYVEEMKLGQYFMNNTIVTTVLPLANDNELPDKFKTGRWVVSGFDNTTNKQFTVICKKLILANGASDLANRLGVKGEGLDMPWVKYELPQLEHALGKFDEQECSRLKPILIVGAGLSAADAVTICRSSGIPVIHVYRNRTAGLDKMLPGNVYPEYHEVHKMMKDSANKYELYTPLPEHTITDMSATTNANGSHRVTVQHLKTGEKREIEISFCAVLIGSRPDLKFISGITTAQTTISPHANIITDEAPINQQTNIGDQLLTSKFSRKLFWLKHICAKCKHLNLCDRNRYKYYQHAQNIDQKRTICGHTNIGRICECPNETSLTTTKQKTSDHIMASIGLGLGEDPSKPIDCKTNPVDVDKYTNAVLRAPQKGLYAMGPLVGDNFVRFIPGGALSITSALHKLNEND